MDTKVILSKAGAICLLTAGILFCLQATTLFACLFGLSAILSAIYGFFYGVLDHPIITGFMMGINTSLIVAIILFL